MNPITRRRAREYALQALYSWQLSKNNTFDLTFNFLSEFDKSDVDMDYFTDLCFGIIKYINKIDKLIASRISNNLKYISFVEKTVLIIGVFELIKKKEISHKIIINEAIELAKTFGTEKSHKFVNAILDKLAVQIRSIKK